MWRCGSRAISLCRFDAEPMPAQRRATARAAAGAGCPDSASAARHTGCMRREDATHTAGTHLLAGIAPEPHRIPDTHANPTE